MAEKISEPRVKIMEDERNEKSIFFGPLSDNEVIKHINSLKNGTSTGEDGIPVSLLKTNHVYLMKPLKHLINSIFNTGIYPKIFKNSIIIPIHKSGDKKLKTNYRPIALTSTLSKFIEKCIKDRLWSFFKKEKLISQQQFGFQEGQSSEDAISEVTNFIVGNFNEGFKTLAVFLDLSKAFDTVDHGILLTKLEKIGIRGLTLKLIESYLSERTQVVKLDEHKSSSKPVECGVPQGTVLGPLLFLVYVNSLTKVSKESRVICFADDTVVLVRDCTWNRTFDKAGREMSKIKHWLDSNLLTLNVEKTQFITFSMTSRGLPDMENMTLHETDCQGNISPCSCAHIIRRNDSIKYLGIYFDQCMAWYNHIQFTNRKLRNILYKFYELRQVVPTGILKIIYKSLVESVLSYGITAWGASCSNNLYPLMITQKYIIKVMLFKKKLYATHKLFNEAKLLNIRQLYIRNIIRFSYKNPMYNCYVSHPANTRSKSKNNLNLPNTLYSSTQRHMSYTIPKILNLIPAHFKQTSYFKIRNIINDWIVGNYGNICGRIPWFT